MVRLAACHPAPSHERRRRNTGRRHVTIALAGNANVGKSVLFNRLTGSSQVIGNWPGKTVERAAGSFSFDGYDVTLVDLPGIYSLSTFSMEELVARDYIASEKPDVVINIIDASVLERNLFFTLQLQEMEVPLVVCLNQMDAARKRGLTVDVRALEAALGVPVVPTAAIRGEGVDELVGKAIEVASRHQHHHRHRWGHGPGVPDAGVHSHPAYAEGVEDRIARLGGLIEAGHVDSGHSPRWLAIKLLEGDEQVVKLVGERAPAVARLGDTLRQEIEATFEEPAFAVLTAERYALANRTAALVLKPAVRKNTLVERLERLTTHRVFGYVTSVAVIAGLLLWTFVIGNYLSVLLSSVFSFFQPVDPKISGPLVSIAWNGVFGGIVAGATLVIPYVIPFYLMLALMEDSGILTRVAFMMDSAMHQMGLHGKAIIPLILGYGCNVPAIQSTRIMGSRRERLLAAFAITFAPCTARTIIILGLVAAFVGVPWAFALYAADLVIMFIAAKVAMRVVPGKLTGLIMEMHSFKVPSLSVVVRQTWARTKSLVYMVFPIYMVGTAAVQVLYGVGTLEPLNRSLSLLTAGWLGLPVIAGALLILGTIRKELILLTLVAVYGTNLAAALSPVQLIVLAFVGMLYLPCAATIAVLAKEFGWKASLAISAANLVTALFLGGLVYRLLAAFL